MICLFKTSNLLLNDNYYHIKLLSTKTCLLFYVLVYVFVELSFSILCSERVSLNTLYIEKNYYHIICFGDFSCVSIIDLTTNSALFKMETLRNINMCNIVLNI